MSDREIMDAKKGKISTTLPVNNKEVDKEIEANKDNKEIEDKWLDIDWSKLKWTLQNI